MQRPLAAALAVMTRNPEIRAFLEVHDPKALEQAREALIAAGWNPDQVVEVLPSRQLHFIGLTWSEAANLAIAASRVDSSTFTPAARGALNRAIAKIGQTIPHNTAEELDRIFLTALEQEGGSNV